ncbi:MAG TPA: DUF89 family protein [Anaerolineae bacterium]|nr:DUF89 family protein [Anaerolineae bacterium]
MRTFVDCYPCFLRQALEICNFLGADEVKKKDVLNKTMDIMQNLDLHLSPPEIALQIQSMIKQTFDINDPYAKVKAQSTRRALKLYPQLKNMVEQSEDKLEAAIKISIAGNIIDFGPSSHFDIEATVDEVFTQELPVFDIGLFRIALSKAKKILYLADNAGETVFDRVLIETLPKHVLYAVKSGPVINDATRTDAEAAGINQVAKIIETGSDAAGTILSRCSKRFLEIYTKADLVIAKGQANLETLSDEGPRVFFLLKVKCLVISEHFNLPYKGTILKRG